MLRPPATDVFGNDSNPCSAPLDLAGVTPFDGSSTGSPLTANPIARAAAET
jgi:hypothetical protein